MALIIFNWSTLDILIISNQFFLSVFQFQSNSINKLENPLKYNEQGPVLSMNLMKMN